MNNHPFAGQKKKKKKQGSRVCYINIFPDVIFSTGLLAFPSRTEPNAQKEIV